MGDISLDRIGACLGLGRGKRWGECHDVSCPVTLEMEETRESPRLNHSGGAPGGNKVRCMPRVQNLRRYYI